MASAHFGVNTALIRAQLIIVPKNEIRWPRDSVLLAKLTLSPRHSKWLRSTNLWDRSSSSDGAKMSPSSRKFRMWIPIYLSGERTTSMHFLKVRGARDSPKGRTVYWEATPSKANLKNRLWWGAIWMWKYASFRSSEKNQSPGNICERICFNVIILNGRFIRTRKQNGVLGGITEAFWGVVQLQRDLALSSSGPIDLENARDVGSSTIFGRGPCCFGGWRLAERERRGCQQRAREWQKTKTVQHFQQRRKN